MSNKNSSNKETVPLSKLPPSKLFRKLVDMYKEDNMHCSVWRRVAKEDFEYYNNKQWDAQDIAEMEKDRRPWVTFNIISKIVNSIVGAERNNKRGIQFVPRHQGKAIPCSLLTGAAEWFRDKSYAEYTDSEAFKDCVISGMGWTSIGLNFDNNPDGDPCIRHLNPLKMVWDYNAVENNLKDAKRLWYVDRKPLSVARELFPDVSIEKLHAGWAETVCDYPEQNQDTTDSDFLNRNNNFEYSGISDIPRKMITLVEARWLEKAPFYRVFDPLTQQVQDMDEQQYEQYVAMMLYQYGQTVQCMKFYKNVAKRAFLGNVLLDAPDNPLAPTGHMGWECITAYHDKCSRHYYGIVRAAKDAQKWTNKFFSHSMQVYTSGTKGGFLVERGGFEDDEEAARDLARSNSIVYMSPGALSQNKIMPKPEVRFPHGLFELFQNSLSMITQITGLSEEFLGTRDVNQAGILEEHRKQSTLNLLSCLFDSLRLYRERQGRTILYLLQDCLSDGRLVRLSGESYMEYVPLLRDQILNVDYDIIIDDAPISPNERDRVFGALMQLMPMFQSILPPDAILDFLKYSPLPATLVQKIIERVEATKNMPPPPPSPEEIKQELTMQKMQQEMESRPRLRELELENRILDAVLKQQKLNASSAPQLVQ